MPLRHLLSFDEFRARYGFKPAEYRQYVVDSNAPELEKATAIAGMLRVVDAIMP